MMISPESYYEEYLKGKTKEEIMTAIRGLKQKIGQLKNSMENPYDGKKTVIHPSEDTRIYWNREYLDIAKQAYVEAGGTYTLSKSEEKAADFDANIHAICKITLNIGGHFGGHSTYIVELSDNIGGYFSGYSTNIVELSEEMNAHTKLWDEKPLLLLDDHEEPFTKNSYIAALKELHIGEWRRRYTTKRFGYMVLDGTRWEVEFEYSNGHKPVKFVGDNSYPYNFDKFQRLFAIDVTEED